MNTNLPVNKILRAQIRYFETLENGCEIPDIKAYTYFLKFGDVYVNIFHPFEECNVYARVPYTNSTKDGESFGSMIRLVNGKEEDGVCYILDKESVYFGGKKYISIEEFEKEIINMDEFIIDRLPILEKVKGIDIFKRKRIIKQDKEKLEKFQDYINSKDKKVLKKIEN